MSLHKSLKSKSKLERRRNVLSRDERIKRLTEEERWVEGDSVFGLHKVKPVTIARPKAKGKAAEEKKPQEGEAATGETAQAPGKPEAEQ